MLSLPADPKDPRASRTEAARDAVQAFVREVGPADAVVESVTPLGETGGDGLKAMGYGRPVRVDFRTQGQRRAWVFRTANRDCFGHERDADRWAALVGAHHDFSRLPRHVAPRALGVLTEGGARVTIPLGTPFLVTEYAPGRPYAEGLGALASEDWAAARDVARAERLAHYLASVHAEPASPDAYRRAARDLVGGGEGIFGLAESYAEHDPIAPRSRLQGIERLAVRWRWRLFERAERARRIHGDFHPFNLLFDDQGHLHVLDASRGAAGEPADDLVALSINYLFFALRARGELCGAMRSLWDRFWSAYLTAAEDPEVLELVAPFFAWRALVLASPAWYPNESAATRDTLLCLAESLLEGSRFDPWRVEELLR
jgi:aminoglycoside phosphotransferase (APT) family kinase protein